MLRIFFIIVICWACGAYSAPGSNSAANWKNIAPGLDIAFFHGTWATPAGDTVITILRVDPENWAFRFLCASELEQGKGMTAKQWCAKYDLAAAVNAGMFATDYKTHVGYLRSRNQVNNPSVNHYQSVVAFSPEISGLPSIRVFDLDIDPMEGILGKYSAVAQNLRLIKRPGINRWPQQAKKWSEAALGEDADGRILFIFVRSPLTMHDLNEILLDLPVALVCAQHLEGGPEAQLYLRWGDFEREFVGSYETIFLENNTNDHAWPIPNVIGIEPRELQGR